MNAFTIYAIWIVLMTGLAAFTYAVFRRNAYPGDLTASLLTLYVALLACAVVFTVAIALQVSGSAPGVLR